MLLRRLAALAALLLLAASCTHVRPPDAPEFRGVWLTTVNNADWPSRPGLPVDEQKRELIAFLDCIAGTHLNAVILQVRPNADAFYASELEPWSDYLTGQLGQAPEPFYDPLAFAVEEAHKRGLELHAWLNPYRGRHPLSVPPQWSKHISRSRPDAVHPYGRFQWMDPGEPAVREHAIAVIRDIVKRYDVDGIHFDDYFYPYPENDASGQEIPFPDDASWQKYVAGGGKLSRDDFRRENVNLLIREAHEAIKAEKPDVQFGVSPFGIWRPHHPRSVRGLDAYARIYADSKKWMQQGWVDYFVPQLYWGTTAKEQRFAHLLKWWDRQNTAGVSLWPGLGAHRVGNRRANSFTADEILEQIRLIRSRKGTDGYILFTANVLMRDRGGLADRLREANGGPVPVPRKAKK